MAAGEYFSGSLARNTKKAQASEVKQELDAAVAELQEELANGRIEAGAVSQGQIKAVQELVQKAGGIAPADAVRWALLHKAGNEAAACSLVLAHPKAREAYTALKHPGLMLLAASGDLTNVSLNQVRRVRALLRSKDAVRRLVESIAAQPDNADEKPTAGADEAEVDDGSTASGAEITLLAWVTRVCEWVEANTGTQPIQQQVMLAERRLADKVRSLDKTITAGRKQTAVSASKLQLPASLFPATAPWKNFPWDRSLLPRTEAEDALREAIDLRDLSMLEALLPEAGKQSLNKRNSRVYFEAIELRDMLAAEAQLRAHTAAAANDDIELPGLRAVSRQASEDREPLSPRSGNMPPPIRREKTEETMDRLGQALDVFVEPVSTTVPSGVPKQRPFVDILSEEAAQFGAFVREEDQPRRDHILATVSSSVGVSDIETEQCREQEQEKAQEQEQEQEIEMERYVDVAYQRDNEEPQRWAFVTLGESRDGGSGAPVAAPFAEGSFYPASEFHLHARSPLPFPSYLAVSRNYFNKEWVGERRIKNAVCVLEWVPDVTALVPSSIHAAKGSLSEAQAARLHSALQLLDVRGTRSYDREALRQVVHAAEHVQLEEAALDGLLGGKDVLSFDEVASILTSGVLRPAEDGRHFVLLSLAEAETIRCILHMRQGKPLVDGANVGLALRCIAAHDAVFDTSANLPPASKYQAAISHNCFRFVDSAMHYKKPELGLLLTSLPVPPSARRLFFSMVVSCRRRLAKRWEQTPLARLFHMEDEWALFKLEALRVRVREAIRARGLLLHDAFLLFDGDDDGLLSLPEVYGALSWLGVTGDVQAQARARLLDLASDSCDDGLLFDVLFLVRCVSREPHLSYGVFMDLFMGSGSGGAESDEQPVAAALTPPGGGAVSAVVVRPKGEATLPALYEAAVAEERATDEQLEREMEAQAERARKFVEAQLLESDFGWMRQTRAVGARNPRTTRTSCYYDLTRGVVGTQKGAPLWMEGCGRWTHVLHGTRAEPCFKGFEGSFVVLRVPFRKCGGGSYCNTWT
eukprot:6943659-Prymnesium_polylepis.1